MLQQSLPIDVDLFGYTMSIVGKHNLTHSKFIPGSTNKIPNKLIVAVVILKII